MGSPIADAPAASNGDALRSGQNDARRTSAPAPHASTAAAGLTADALTMRNPTGTTGAPGVAAITTVVPTVNSAGGAAAHVPATTAAVAAAAEKTLATQRAPLDVDSDGAHAAAGALVPPLNAAETHVSTAARALFGDVREAKTFAAREVRETEASALAAEAEPAAPPISGEILRSKSAPEAEEPKGNNAAGAAAALRHATARQRRNAGRQRSSVGAGKAEADGGDSEDPAASGCGVLPIAGTVPTSTTRGGGSSASASRRELEKVRKRYEPLLRETEDALQKVIAQGLPEAETLTHPPVYLELKRTILYEESPLPGEESTTITGDEDGETCREAESENNSLGLSRIKRLLRALCEGSSLPLSKLIRAVRVVLLDETDGAPQENVSAATLQSLIPVLLARRSLGIPPRRGTAAAVAVSSPADAKSNPCSAESDSGIAVAPAATRAAKATADTASRAASSASLAEAGNASPGVRSSSSEGDTEASTGDSTTAIAAAKADVAAAPVAAPTTGEQGLSSVFAGGVGGFDRNEDTTPSCLWMWESAFLEGLPAAFKEKAKKDRERRAVVSRRVRSLLRLQQAIEQGNEKEILTAQEKVAALEKKQQQEEERRREQQLKKRRAEEARLEKEREKKQKEDAKREKEKEKKKIEEQQKQAQQQTAGGGGVAMRLQTPAVARTEKTGPAQKVEKKKELPSSMLNQQLLMASWLTRKPLSLFSEKASRTSLPGGDTGGETKSSSRGAPARGTSTAESISDSPGADSGVQTDSPEQGGDKKEAGDSVGSTEAAAKRRQAVCSNGVTLPKLPEGKCFPWRKTRRKDSFTEEDVVEVGGDAGNREELLEKKAKEAARTRAAAEAALWRVPEGMRHQFVERVLSLPKALVPLPSSSDAQIPFFDGPEDPSASTCCDPDEYLKAFVESCAVPHSEAWRDFYSFFAINRQYVYRLPPGGCVTQPQLSSNGGTGEGTTHTYCQELREVRKGLALTDYVDASLPDLQYLRTVLINLDEWKRPVRRLLLGKRAGRSTAWEQCMEESCIDYDRDSDEEWFETFDVDDLDDGREEEEEEDQEADEDKDWLVDDDDDVGGIKTGGVLLSHGVRFQSLCDWQWTFEGEEKPNDNDVPDACLVPTLRDPGWLSVYGCVVDDWGGEPFAMLNVTVTPTRRKLTDEDLCGFFRFCHGKIVSKVKLLAHFHRENRHLRKSDLEKKFKEHMAYERRPQDKQKRWYVSCRAAEALNLKEELDAVLEATRDEEALREAAQSPSQDFLVESAADVATAAVQQSHLQPSSRETHQAKGNSDGSPREALDESHSRAGGGSIERLQTNEVATESVSELEFGNKEACCSPTLLTSSPTKNSNSVSAPSTTDQEGVHGEGLARPCRAPGRRKSSNSVTYSALATGSATPDTSTSLPASSTSITNSSLSAGSASSIKNSAGTPPPVTTPIAQNAKEKKIFYPFIGVDALTFEETDELKEQRTAQDVGYSPPREEDKIDLMDTVDPFASAAATAAHAALSAQAAAAAAYEQRPAEFASATCVALAALTAAKLAKEVALQMSGSFQSSRKCEVVVPSVDFLPSSVCSGGAAPKSPSAQGSGFLLQSVRLDGSVLSPKVQESSYDAVGTSMSATFGRMASEAHDQVAIATPIKTSPAKGVIPCSQQYSPTNENANDSVMDANDAGSNSGNVRKRRRSDGSLRSCCGSADGSVVTTKRAKRPSCPSGTPAAFAGSQLKNALITKFFRVVPQAPKRMSDDASDETS